jgi:hypothetical protein
MTEKDKKKKEEKEQVIIEDNGLGAFGIKQQAEIEVKEEDKLDED